MLSSEVIFTSYCFGNSAAQGDYKPQQDRLRNSILSIYPDANIHFVYEPEETGKPKFQKSLYGFKVQMINECLQKGFKKIVYLDAAVTLQNKVDHWFEIIKDYGVLAIKDNNSLENVTWQKAADFVGVAQDQLKDIRLLGGSVFVFDFDVPICRPIFDHWEAMKLNGLFGTQEDCTNGVLGGHRMDETCMALTLHKFGIPSLGYDTMKYGYIHPSTGRLNSSVPFEELIACKMHFK